MLMGNMGLYRNGATFGSQFILNQIGGASAAYSLRRMNENYNGPAIRVRRSSDTAEQDIGFATSPQTRINFVPNPLSAGSIAGTPGTLPTGWTYTGTPVGITTSVVGSGIGLDGLPFVDLRYNGTPNANAGGRLLLSPVNAGAGAPATLGERVTESLGMTIVGGTSANITFSLRYSERSSSGGLLFQLISPTLPVTTTPNRFALSGIVNNASTTRCTPEMQFTVRAGLAVDVTIRLVVPNIEVGQKINVAPLLTTNETIVSNVGELDLNALDTFLTSTESAFVTTWYDQSGNSRNVAQSTSAAQPRIVNAGVVDTIGVRPTVVFDGVDDFLVRNNSFLYAQGNAMVNAIIQAPNQSDRRLVSEGNSLTAQPVYALMQSTLAGNSSSQFIRNEQGFILLSNALDTAVNTFNNIPTVITHNDSGSAVLGYKNSIFNSNNAYARSGTMPLDRFSIGALVRNSAVSFYTGKVSEIVTTPFLNDSNRLLLEQNQISNYGII